MHDRGPAAVQVVHATRHIQCDSYPPLVIQLQRTMLARPVIPTLFFKVVIGLLYKA